MRKPTQIETLYIDFDAFFANVEKQLCPDIRGYPVGITALDSEYSAFITRCYMAKAAGLKRGTRVRDARVICPDVVVRVARPDIYVQVHNQILDEIDRHVPVEKVWSIDEMECTLIGRERTGALDLAKRVRAGIEKNIGPYVTPSIGLAPNQFLAKVASEMKKPRGLIMLRPEDLPGPLLDLSLTDLPGISGNMERRLNASGVMSVEDFWNISPKHARKIWHSVEGERMWAQLHGYAVSRPDTQTSMFGHSRVLTKGWNSPSRAIECLNLLTVKAAYRLRRAGYLCRSLSVAFRIQDGTKRGYRWSGQTSFAPCSDDPSLLTYMQTVFDGGIAQVGKRAHLKGVYVMLHDIGKPEQISGELFAPATARDQTVSKGRRPDWDKVMRSMDGLNQKYGRAVVHIGSRKNLPGGYAGGKIAFGRVPTAEDFF